MIYVCSLEDVSDQAAALGPAHLVSLVEPEYQPPTPPGVTPDRHLRVMIHDISEPLPGHILPEAHHVSALLEFLDGWHEASPLLLHCFAGISRSMAAALIALCRPAAGREHEAARRLRAAAPHARPNRRIVALADRLLRRGGRLSAALSVMGPAAIPETSTPLARIRPLSLD